MNKVRYLILGGGPAGLAFAAYLNEHNEKSFILLEKENTAGGLCRSVMLNGIPVDIGGGHFLDARSKEVDDFLLKYMPLGEWNSFDRDSQIWFDNQFMGSPFEANIWQLPVERQIEYLKSIAVAGCNIGTPEPEKFVDWIEWKLGKAIARDYMMPYNQKMFSKNLNDLGTYWLAKLPNVSFDETLRSCLEHHFYGQQPCHSHFYYPKKFGYGELWERIARSLGNNYVGNYEIHQIDCNSNTVNGEFEADNIIVTIPWTEFKTFIGMPEKIQNGIRRLKYSSVQIDYFNKPFSEETTAQWIYYPDLKYSWHRVMLMTNFVPHYEGYWTETNSERVDKNNGADYSYMNQYAYPHNTLDKPGIMEDLLDWSRKKRIYGLGRWGEWRHFNSDVVVERAITLAEKLTEAGEHR